MVDAAKGLLFLLVDCSGGSQREMQTKYGVKGYPSIIFCDSKGKQVDKLRGRDATTVATLFAAHAKKYTLGVKWAKSLDAALAKSRKSSKPTLVWIFDKKKKKSPIIETFFIDESLAKTLERFELARVEFERKSEVTEKLKLNSGAAVYILDASSENPYKAFAKIRGIRSVKKLKKELTRTLKDWDKQKSRDTAGK